MDQAKDVIYCIFQNRCSERAGKLEAEGEKFADEYCKEGNCFSYENIFEAKREMSREDLEGLAKIAKIAGIARE